MASADIIEDFKPVPVDPGSGRWSLIKFRLRSWADLQLLTYTDSVAEALAHIEEHAVQKFRLRRVRAPRRTRWFGE